MTVLITTNEPREIKDLFIDKLEVPMGFDFMLYTKKGKVGIERKAVPGDLLASVTDGRLSREMVAMREETDFQILLLHGSIIYRKDDSVYMRGNKGRNWTKKGVTNLLRTTQYVEGVYIEWANSDIELVKMMHDLQEYFDQSYHLSFRVRPGLQTNWIVPSHEEKVMHFLQGLPHISAVRAKMLVSRFPTPMSVYEASVEELSDIRGIGKKMATDIYNFLRGIK